MFVWMPRIGNSRSAHTRRADRLLARRARRDDLGEQRVVVHRHVAAFLDARVDANARHARFAVEQDAPGLRQEAARGIFRVHPRLDGVAPLCDARGRPRQRLVRGDEQLRPHEIDAGHLFGHPMLHLQARVHLEVVEAFRAAAGRRVDEELDRPGVAVAGGAGRADGRLGHPRAQARVGHAATGSLR